MTMEEYKNLEEELLSTINKVKENDGFGDYIYIGKENIKKLENILMPRFSKEENSFKVAFKCDADYKSAIDLYRRIDAEADELNESLKDIYGDTKLSISLTSKRSGSISKLISIGTNGSDPLFRIQYDSILDAEEGNLELIFSKNVTENITSCKNIFKKIWEEIILDNERVSNVFDKYNEEYDLDDYYKNSKNTFIQGQSNSYQNGNLLEKKVTKPNLWDRIGGYTEIKKIVEMELVYPLKNQTFYKDLMEKTMGIQNRPEIGPILFYGPPGTGKTMMANAIAGRAGLEFSYISLFNIISRYMGEGPEKLRDAMNLILAARDKNTLLFIDEIDSIGSRNSKDSSAADLDDRRLVNTFLTKLDEITETRGSSIIVVGATNSKGALDKAILSRFKDEIYFPLPSKDDRENILPLYIKHLDKADISRLAAATDGFSCRDIKNMSERAIKIFLKDYVENGRESTLPDINDYLKSSRQTTEKYKIGGSNDTSAYA